MTNRPLENEGSREVRRERKALRARSFCPTAHAVGYVVPSLRDWAEEGPQEVHATKVVALEGDAIKFTRSNHFPRECV